MSTKEELLSKFASQTGAEIPGIQTKQDDNTQININTEATEPTETTTTQEDEELFKDSYSDRTLVPPWQDPKYKGVIVTLCVLPAVLAAAWVFKDGIPKPKLSTKAPNPTRVAPPSDQDQPKEATDGEWASYAATNGMRQQFASAAESENSDALKKFQDQANARNKAQGSSATVKPNTRIVRSVPTERTNVSTNNVPPYRSVSRSYTPPAPIRTAHTNIPRDYLPDYSTVSRSYTPPVQEPSFRNVAPAVRALNSPARSKPSVVATKNSQSIVESQQQQNSPQERIAAMIAATSTFQGSNEPATVASAAIPPTSAAIVNSASTARPSALQAVYSPDPLSHLPSEAAVIDGQPQTLINRSLSAKGMLLTSIAFTSGDYASLADQPVEIELKEALGDIPAGARIVAVVEAHQSNRLRNSKSEVVRLNPIALIVGDMEMPLPDGAIMLSGKNNAPLIAKRGGSDFLRFVGGLAGTVAGGAGATNFGAFQNVQIGNSSYFKSIGANIATNIVSNAAQELQQAGEGDSILILKAGSSITISVHKPITLPLLSNLPDTQQPVVQQLEPELNPESVSQVLTDAEAIASALHQQSDFKGVQEDATQN
ncbi:MAG: hypothetical protein KME05_05170 [Gloeocapsa sp. UFS-A4-WI-NPMV-4B04]|jgi:hypothetical protein|nr:hypothetical protein [Gloeocapsa sp. UFS-A4-WI-NPMV-4B04]